MDTLPKQVGISSRNKEGDILKAAAHLFSRHGYHATSMRDIAKKVGMLPGSIYYHYASKHDLLYAVYKEGVESITKEVEAAVAGIKDAEERLKAACEAHIGMLLGSGYFAPVIIRVRPSDVKEIEAGMIELRESYEILFRDLIDDVDLPPGVDARYFRLLLFGAMNWAQTWYHPKGDPPQKIIEQFFRILFQKPEK